MIGLVLVTHGRLAEELRLAMEHVVGAQRNCEAICIGPDDDMETRREDVRGCVARVDQGDGVVLLTDMFGGSPSNLAISAMREGVEVLSGVNLPMLVKLAKVRSSQTLAECVECATNAGRKYIAAASAVLPSCRRDAARAMSPGALRDALLNGACDSATLAGSANGAPANGAGSNGAALNGAGAALPGLVPSLAVPAVAASLASAGGPGGKETGAA